MPTYQYACTECGHAFEAVQSFSDDALTECSECSGRLRKVFSSVGIVFKGSGFYRNDSREAAKSAATATDKTGTDKGDKGTDKKEKVGAAAADSTATKSDSAASSPAKTPAPSSSSPSGSSGGKSKSSTAGTAA